MMALYDQKLGREEMMTHGAVCQNVPIMQAYHAWMPWLDLDSGETDSVLVYETLPRSYSTMAEHHDQTEKQDRLRKAGTLNRTPDNVSDPMFTAGDFFDARDLLQVRYEMVRLVRIGQATLAQAAARFGVSRPTCFRMVKAFDSAGLQGLIPAPRGPRGPHKITPQMLRFVDDYRARHGRVGARRLVPLIEAEFGVRVHPRGLEKALERSQKKLLGAGP